MANADAVLVEEPVFQEKVVEKEPVVQDVGDDGIPDLTSLTAFQEKDNWSFEADGVSEAGKEEKEPVELEGEEGKEEEVHEKIPDKFAGKSDADVLKSNLHLMNRLGIPLDAKILDQPLDVQLQVYRALEYVDTLPAEQRTAVLTQMGYNVTQVTKPAIDPKLQATYEERYWDKVDEWVEENNVIVGSEIYSRADIPENLSQLYARRAAREAERENRPAPISPAQAPQIIGSEVGIVLAGSEIVSADEVTKYLISIVPEADLVNQLQLFQAASPQERAGVIRQAADYLELEKYRRGEIGGVKKVSPVAPAQKAPSAITAAGGNTKAVSDPVRESNVLRLMDKMRLSRQDAEDAIDEK